MKILLYIFLFIFSTQTSAYDRFLGKVISVAQQNVNFKLDREIQEQIDDLKKIYLFTLKSLSKKATSKDVKKFINLINTYFISNLIAIYMIQRSIVIASNPDFKNQYVSLVEQGKIINEINTNFKMLADKYNIQASSINEEGLEKLKEAIRQSKPFSSEDLEIMDLLWIRYTQIVRAKGQFESFLKEFDLVSFGKNILKAIKEEYKLDISDVYFDEFINLISSLLRFKSFMSEGAPLKLRNSLYRFIQLYPLFMILDQIRPIDEVYKVLLDMQTQGKQLQQVFDNEYRVIIGQATHQVDKVTQSINQKNKDLIKSFNELLKIVDEAAFNVGLKLYSKDLAVIQALI